MKVIALFRDKFTKKVYKKGDSYTHKDEKRIAFLIEKGFLEEIKDDKEPGYEKKEDNKENKAEK
jgi:hypothetical protein